MCPKCNVDDSRVLETRRHANQVYRRRKCVCSFLFISREYSGLAVKFPEALKALSIARIRKYEQDKMDAELKEPEPYKEISMDLFNAWK